MDPRTSAFIFAAITLVQELLSITSRLQNGDITLEEAEAEWDATAQRAKNAREMWENS